MRKHNNTFRQKIVKIQIVHQALIKIASIGLTKKILHLMQDEKFVTKQVLV